MKTSDFRYEVHINVFFTDKEITIIKLCMMGHYDAHVKAAANPGGFLYGWRNYIDAMIPTPTTLTCSFDQLDTCAKAVEQPIHNEGEEYQAIRFRLAGELKNALESINAETRQLHGE